MADKRVLLDRLDTHWAAHLGCAPRQLRDGAHHVVARPAEADGTPPPWPLRRGPVALVTTGTGWVLSVPVDMLERANSLCAGLSFDQHVAKGDKLGQQWFDGGAHNNPHMKRSEVDAAYRVMANLVSVILLRGWSHYVLSYAHIAMDKTIPDPHVQRLTPDNPVIWEQFQKWPAGSMCGPHLARYFPISDAFGFVLDGKLVSVAQLEAISEEVEWEYGVDTLPEYRGCGFATAVLRTVTKYIIEQGKVPWHYTDHYNRPSRRLPGKLGYFQFGEGLFSRL